MNLFYKIFASVFVFLGMADFVAAQYGAPMSSYKFIGNVISSETHKPVPDLKITLSGENINNQIETYTDQNGNFFINFFRDDYFDESKWKIHSHDTDGIANGEFPDFETDITLNNEFFNGSDENSRWTKQNKDPYPLFIKPKESESEKHPPKKPDSGDDDKKKYIPDSGQDTKTNPPSPSGGDENLTLINGKYTEEIIKINIFPNPAPGIFTIEISATFSDDVNIFVYSSEKKLIFEKYRMINNDKIIENIDLVNYSNGIYFIEIKTNNESYLSKILKK